MHKVSSYSSLWIISFLLSPLNNTIKLYHAFSKKISCPPVYNISIFLSSTTTYVNKYDISYLQNYAILSNKTNKLTLYHYVFPFQITSYLKYTNHITAFKYTYLVHFASSHILLSHAYKYLADQQHLLLIHTIYSHIIFLPATITIYTYSQNLLSQNSYTKDNSIKKTSKNTLYTYYDNM